MKTFRRTTLVAALLSAATTALFSVSAFADVYRIDPDLSSVNFRIQHLGVSWVTGRFNHFSGQFAWDPAAPEQTSADVTLDPASIDTNQSARDEFLRSKSVLDTATFASARFHSTAFKANLDNDGKLSGELTLHGVTRAISLPVRQIGATTDAQGNGRMGFEGVTVVRMSDYGIDAGPAVGSGDVMLEFFFEGVRQAQT
ncbi:YceI family protein [Thalassolituus sp. LLYu03]|uniref:YceI family protein n=1 Tax=Thalassolituus sp. LLYu03 TaxID=3421656 RepID=UPI003D28514E